MMRGAQFTSSGFEVVVLTRIEGSNVRLKYMRSSLKEARWLTRGRKLTSKNSGSTKMGCPQEDTG